MNKRKKIVDWNSFCKTCSTKLGVNTIKNFFCSRKCYFRYKKAMEKPIIIKRHKSKPLTKKEIEILLNNDLFAEEKAQLLNMSYKSVEYHFYKERSKLLYPKRKVLSFIEATNRDYRAFNRDKYKQQKTIKCNPKLEDYKARKILDRIKKGEL